MKTAKKNRSRIYSRAMAAIEYQIKEISWQETIDLRHRVLVPHKLKEDCFLPNDDAASSMHLGLFIGDTLAAICTFHEEPLPGSPDTATKSVCRLRQMAVEFGLQHLGLGAIILNAGLKMLQEKGVKRVWCHARWRAFSFYQRVGFEYISDLFEIPMIGPHKTMCMDLK